MKCSLHPGVHVSKEDCSEHSPSVSQSPGSGQVWLAFCLSPRHPIQAHLYQDLCHQVWPLSVLTDSTTITAGSVFALRNTFCFIVQRFFNEKVKCWFSWFALRMKWRVAGYRILKDSLVTPPRATNTLLASRFFSYYLNVAVQIPSHSTLQMVWETGQKNHSSLPCTTCLKMFWFSYQDVFLQMVNFM